MCGAEVFFKCENFQKTGAFKARGALNAVLQLLSETRHVVTHSSGNHGAALAWAARETGRQATVICPRDASTSKREAIARYGGHIVDCASTIESREQALEEFLTKNEATFIPPYNDSKIIVGQGTATYELLSTNSDLKEIWVPVGGGGLCSGTIVGANGRARVVGCEPLLASDAHDSMKAGSIQPPLPPVTAADGLRSGIGKLNFEIMQAHELQINLVSEEEIVSAMRLIWQLLKIVIEPSSAVPVAGLLKYSRESVGRVGVILSGGNYTPS